MLLHVHVYKGRHEFVRKELGSSPGTVLDVGNLGDGESSCALLKKDVEDAGGTYMGLDSNEPLTKKLNLPNQKIGDLHHAPFEDNTFDAIYAGEIIEHTWTPGLMISECYRILKPQGRLILDTPNPYSMPRMLQFILKKKVTMGDVRSLTYHEAKNTFESLKQDGETLLQPQHKLFFTPAMLKQLFETHGLVLESVSCTKKPRGILHNILITLFPHTGSHLCVVARKATIDEAFADVIHS